MRMVYPKESTVKQRKSKPLPRKVHINGQEWRWEFSGKGLKVLSPSNRYRVISWSDFHGDAWPEISGNMLCDCDDCVGLRSVTPSEVKEYIKKNLLAEEVGHAETS